MVGFFSWFWLDVFLSSSEEGASVSEMGVGAGVLASFFFLQHKTGLCWAKWWKLFGISLISADRQLGS